jgi:cytidylate kinase
MPEHKNIIISGLPVSGKSKIAELLADEYKMAQFSIGKMLRAEHLKEYPNNEVSFYHWWSNLDINYQRKIAEGPNPALKKGGVVLDTRYVAPLDKEGSLLIFVTADINTRIEMVMRRGDYAGEPVTEIKSRLEQREANELRIGMELFNGTDYRDPNLYHLVINSGTLSIQDELKVVKSIFGSFLRA